MDHPEGAGSQRADRVDFDRRVRLEFRSAQLSSDGGLLVMRELDDALGLSDLASASLRDNRIGRNTVHRLEGLFRQSVFGRLAGYEDVNDAEQLLGQLKGYIMQLAYTPSSPFGRTVRIVLAELGLTYDDAGPLDTAEERARFSPTLQLPALRDGDVQLWDSLVIAEYLLGRYPGADQQLPDPPLCATLLREGRAVEDRLQLATMQTLAATAANVLQFIWTGRDYDRAVIEENLFLQRNRERVHHLLDWAEREITSETEGFVPGVLSVQDILLVSAATLMDRRPIGLGWRSPARPRIATLVARLEARPSFLATAPVIKEPGVERYLPDGTAVAPAS